MALSIVSTTFITTGEGNIPVTLSVQTLIPPDTTHTPATTRYIHPNGKTVDIYVSYTKQSTGEEYGPSTVTMTLTPATQRPEPTNSEISTTSAPETTSSESASQSTTGSSSRITRSATTTQTGQSETFTRPALHSSSNDSSVISTEALIGAIIASVIGTFLLTLLVSFLFLRFRRRRQHRAQQHPPKDLQPESSASSLDKVSSAFALSSDIPTPADDDTVRTRILTLIDQAVLHVDNYYVPSSSPILSEEDRVRLEKYNSEYLPASLPALLQGRNVQRKVITHTLVYTLLKAISSGGDLMPNILKGLPQVDYPSHETDSALFAWRMLTSHLYNQSNPPRPLSPISASAARALATEFTKAFAPYTALSFANEDRLSHMTSLATAAGELGVWLFGQPCSFEFVWVYNGSGAGEGFMVSPAVVKVKDEEGRRLSEPFRLVEGDGVDVDREEAA
ncbi:hypothetical protein BJY04DRAFT_217876 [Aspergillus karnatakaensis]|uniref:uncharacterized protein n=1 Tax=Aspergillus karnatakaensis TaxID=1810916 RepID=UPI003CCD93EF